VKTKWILQFKLFNGGNNLEYGENLN
jgi:hypothetical protein